MFVEGRAAEVDLLKGRLRFDVNCRTEEIDVKKRKLEKGGGKVVRVGRALAQ